MVLANAKTNDGGNYSHSWTPQQIGTYFVKANWTGDEYTLSAETSARQGILTKV